MHQLDIDKKRLSEGLEKGIEQVDGIVAVDREFRLRMSYCGVASYAIAGYFSSEGYETRLVESNPRLAFEKQLRHVMVEVEADKDKIIVDGTYSQFLEFVGLTPGYVVYSGQDEYPEEKIAVFDKGNGQELADRITSLATHFQKVNIHPDAGYGIRLGHGPLESASVDRLRHTYEAVWDSHNFRDYRPSNAVKLAGQAIQSVLTDHMHRA